MTLQLFLTIITTFFLSSCQDDPLFDSNGHAIEGLSATVTVKIDMSEMSVKSRALVDEDGANFCENVWLGVFLKSTGACTFSNIYDKSDTEEEIDVENTLGKLTFTTTSGESYIVAIANIDSFEALPTPTSSLSQAVSLRSLLENIQSWDAFKQICIKHDNITDIHQMTYDLTMAGYYTENKDANNKYNNYELTSADELPTVEIVSGVNQLPGAILLRRIISYNKFNITAGDNIDLYLQSWQVCNNPYYSYVMESGTNAGDYAQIYSDSNTESDVYNSSEVNTYFERDPETGARCFDFYQFENKHTACNYDGKDDYTGIRSGSGLTATQLYADREREWKDTDSGNTGIYKSLVNNRNDKTSMANNNASYVVLKAKISYYIPDTPENRANPDDESIKAVDPNTYTGDKIHRTADATYVIHLGYCEGKDDNQNATRETAIDFNCRRNTKYTYNVKINGVRNIVVEARSSVENQPGVEGSVYDLYGDYMELDSHYCAFNIKLSNKERASLKYHMQVPIMSYGFKMDLKINSEQLDNDPDLKEMYVNSPLGNKNGSKKGNEWYAWIKIKPTSGEKTLAIFNEPDKGKIDDSSSKNYLWSLEDLRDVENFPGYNGSTDTSDETQQWYTVFVDEYVYHDDDKMYGETSWAEYTNLDDRKVEFITTNSTSADNNSEYMLCKYAFSQKSIQTYYSSVEEDESGLGVEHTNESLYLNLRWDSNFPTSANYTGDDPLIHHGLYNIYNVINANQNTYTWDALVQQTTPCHIDKGESKSGKTSHDAADYPVPQLKPMSGSTYSSDYDPSKDDANYYYVNTACMNRNRDLDGDGKISADEIRWYLPTYDQYVEIMIGLDGLVDPIIDWNDYDERYFVDPVVLSTNYRDFLHFAAADGKWIWAEEGFSNSGSLKVYGGSDAGFQAYNIRCVRNLGTNYSAAPTSSTPYQDAYTKNDDNTISLTRYVSACIRPYVSGGLAPHKVSSKLNRPYSKFEVATGPVTNVNNGELKALASGALNDLTGHAANSSNLGYYAYRTNLWYHSLETNDFCGQYTQEAGGKDLGTWRVPNYKELALMSITGLIPGTHTPTCTYEYFVNFDKTNSTYTSYLPYGLQYAFFGSLGATNLSRSILNSDTNLQNLYIRCVRDVK